MPKKITPEPLEPEEAIKMIEEEKKRKEEEAERLTSRPAHNGDMAAKEAELLGSTKEAIQLRKAEIDGEIRLRQANLKGEIDTIKANETAKEKAGKHLAVFGAFYLCFCVIGFLFSMTYLSENTISIAATLITLVVTQLAGILKTVVDTKEPKDPVQLMSEIVHHQMGNPDYDSFKSSQGESKDPQTKLR